MCLNIFFPSESIPDELQSFFEHESIQFHFLAANLNLKGRNIRMTPLPPFSALAVSSGKQITVRNLNYH